MAPNRFLRGRHALGAQFGAMKQDYPDFQPTWLPNGISWHGSLQPTEMSQTYNLRIVYKIRCPPEVFVKSPALLPRGPEPVPHLYSASAQKLCLFLPGTGEWTESKLIAKTIMPWTMWWLHHYELWRATGTWLGGGVHPE